MDALSKNSVKDKEDQRNGNGEASKTNSVLLDNSGDASTQAHNHQVESDIVMDERKDQEIEHQAMEMDVAVKLSNTEELFKNSQIEGKSPALTELRKNNIFSPIKKLENVQIELLSPELMYKNQGFDYSKPIYLCKNCQVLLSYEERNPDYSILKAAFNYRIDDTSPYDKFTQIYCVKCESEIGVKIKNDFYIYSPIFQQKACHLKLGLFSLKADELDKFEKIAEAILDDMNLPFTITKQILTKSSLKTLTIKQEFDACVLIHKKEGRLLLTDATGIYSEFLLELNRKSKGNFLTIITEFGELDNPQESENFTNYDTRGIETLATTGQQPLLRILAKDFKIVTVNEEYNTFQLSFLKNFFHKSLYKSIVAEELENYNSKFSLIVKKNINLSRNQKALEKSLFVIFKDDKEFLHQLLEELKCSPKNSKEDNCQLI